MRPQRHYDKRLYRASQRPDNRNAIDHGWSTEAASLFTLDRLPEKRKTERRKKRANA